MTVRLEGRASHSGGTPMHLRHDALVAAAECVLLGDTTARDQAHHGTRVTVGRLGVEPGSVTTIPGATEFSVDVRDVDGVRQRETAEALAEGFAAIAGRHGVHTSVNVIGDTSPVVLPVAVADHTRAACEELGLSYLVLASGASHDAQQVNRVTPAGMIFVPSLDGLSHVPEEHTTAEEIALGTRVLVETLLRLDRS
jgi:allantoate deiminase